METDASDYALGAILSIQTNSGDIHPVAFHSCSFTPAKINYDTQDKELLAIFAAFTTWRHYSDSKNCFNVWSIWLVSQIMREIQRL